VFFGITMQCILYLGDERHGSKEVSNLYMCSNDGLRHTEEALWAKVRKINAECEPFDCDVSEAVYCYGVGVAIDGTWQGDVLRVETHSMPWRYIRVSIKCCVSDAAAIALVDFIMEWNSNEVNPNYVELPLEVSLFPPSTAHLFGKKGSSFQEIVRRYTTHLSDVVVQNAGGVRGEQQVVVSKRFYEQLMRSGMSEFKVDLVDAIKSAQERVDWTQAIMW